MASRRLSRTIHTEKKAYNIPDGQLTYSDLNRPAKPLFSKRYRITGKPDYIVRQKDFLVPVELKTGRYSQPQKNHILQLAAYCQLLEDTSGRFVPQGILVYTNTQQFTITFDPKLRFELESTIDKMRAALRNGTIQKNHSDSARCSHCSMRKYCSDKVS